MRSVFNVAGTIAERSDWKLSNLSLQKLSYLAQMLHLGQKGTPLFQEDFEAWDYGPIVPRLYHQLKMFGSGPVAAYSSLRPIETSIGADESEIYDEIVELGKLKKPGQLVAITHWDGGAWADSYSKHIRNILIPKDKIREEYFERTKQPA